MRFQEKLEARIAGKHKANVAMADFRDKKIIDWGCGIGVFEKLVAKEAKSIIGIEPSEDIEIAKKNINYPNVRFIKSDIFKFKTKDKFDIAVLFDVIEHLPKNTEIKALKNINKLLKKNGLLLISTPKKNFSKFFDPAWYLGHRHYSVNNLCSLLEKSGFRVFKTYTRGAFYEMLNMFLFYPFKWIFKSEVPFKKQLDKMREKEYLGKNGFITLFIVAKKYKDVKKE